jgi:hypothetical protein
MFHSAERLPKKQSVVEPAQRQPRPHKGELLDGATDQRHTPMSGRGSSGHDFSRLAVVLNAGDGVAPIVQEDQDKEKHRKDKPIDEKAAPAPAQAPSKKGKSDEAGCMWLHAGKVDAGRPPKFPKSYGYTVPSPVPVSTWPTLNIKTDSKTFGGYTAIPEETKAPDPNWQAYAIPESAAGYKVTADDSDNPTFLKYVLKYPNYEYYVRISAKANKIIVAAEEQHIADLDRGWAIIGRSVANAINITAKEDPVSGANPIAAKNASIAKVEEKLGKLGTAMHGDLAKGGTMDKAITPFMNIVAEKSRQGRDVSKKHDIGMNFVSVDEAKKQVLFEANEDFELDKTPSKDIISIKTILPDETKATP